MVLVAGHCNCCELSARVSCFVDDEMTIKTWHQRCIEHPAHQTGMVTHAMIMARMQEEIDELRQELARLKRPHVAQYDALRDRKGA